MNFKPYPRYKPSRVDWLGDVPERWAVTPLKHLVHSLESGVSVNAIDTPAASNEVGVLKTSCVFGDVFRPEENKAVWETEHGRVSCPVKKNSLIVSRMNTPSLVGSCGYVSEDLPHLFLPDRLWMISLKNDIAKSTTKFFWYVLTSSAFKTLLPVVATGTSDSMKNISQGDFFSLPVPFPPPAECEQIANFLNRETAKIDTLIAKQENLIELLKEKRQAVILHGVTKGVDPTVPMKRSGVEWLGDVPEHWKLMPLKYTVISIGQGWSPQCENYPASGDEWGILKVGCVNGGKFRADENKALPPHLASIPELAVMKDDLLISRANTRELVGSAAVATRDYSRLLLCDKLYRLRLDRNRCVPHFLSYLLGTPLIRSRIELEATGASSSMVNIGQGTILELNFAFPSANEQESIVIHLDNATHKIDILIAKAEQAITLQKEHRIALISAAVTGKIDVREAASELQEAA